MAIPASPDDRRPLIWAVSAHRLTEVFRTVSPELAGRAAVEIIDKGFDDAIADIARRSEKRACDVIVAAGAHGEYLRQNLAIPVAFVKVGGFDLMAAICKARQLSERIAMVMHRRVPPALHRFAELFSLPMQIRAYQTSEDARHCIQELAAAGIDVVVGPGLIANLADEAGLTGILVYSLDSVRAAFDDAIEIAAAQKAEKSRRTQLDSVLYHLNDGVIAVDMAGRIVAANPSVDKLTGRSVRNALGQPLRQVLPDLSPGHVMTRGASEIGSVQELGGKSLVVDRVPLLDEGVQTGAIFTLHGSSELERAVGKLRAHSHRRSRAARYRLDDVVAESAAMRQVIAQCRVFAEYSDAAVLIHGESGTGKELLAQGIHNASRRRRHPFIAINCGAFTETLLESELFGYDEGAFTGARRQGKAGLFESANEGTLFLDEIGEMPLPLQTRLLRALQEKEITRVGSVDTIPVDVRIVAATHRNLLSMVRAGDFREDLYYRLNILQVVVPPLRGRPEDIDALARRLLPAALRRAGLDDAVAPMLTASLPVLREGAWPGNVRELENVVERLTMACLTVGRPLLRREVRAMLADEPARQQARAVQSLSTVRAGQEAAHVCAVLAECGGNHQEAARRLGISRTTLWRKIKAARV
ncbi:propionate catabolism operon regulatory protein PrpR [Pigmentiphaga sp. NML080357]|uniref:propionate catabolism operon regulatory protein PrpR n=1 Tax=Pigmentiphaga sp. NML080357 TaxID=2008675 RepID=UPI000B413BB5|nr:propionate catabolism operon regulatory protein PrpR [Pigmentiphaga sp. NML080357]OVZ58290.1 propionate catabolism operon regulatory protein PrpR [Pigmentiphaga sp. NML080357]